MRYLLITPARNEEAFIELTIQSVIDQTIRPARWLIVSDGSTDRTDEIVDHYAQGYNWIELLKMPPRSSRDFGGKALCVNAGYAQIEQLPHDIIGSLDADISFQPDYFEFLLGRFGEDPKLGVAGTPFAEGGMTYDYRFSSADHVSGACQLFRRECFADVGGYVQSKGGGIDVIAVLSARMKGWRTRTFTEMHSVHHRPMGSAVVRRRLAIDFKHGEEDYLLGFHPLWEVFRSIYQMRRRPYVLGGAELLSGYLWAMARRVERPVSRELMQFERQDQMKRLRNFFRSKFNAML